MTGQVIEWAPFALKDGVDEAALMAASRALQDGFLGRQAGFVRRELVREAAGRYVDIVWWSDLAAAEAAMSQAMASAACGGYFALMRLDPENPAAGIRHFSAVARY
jgi:hypothetical protein